MIVKAVILAISLILSLAAQVNLKSTASELPSSWGMARTIGFTPLFVLVMRVGLLSGASLLMSWFAYRKFGFLEFLIGTALFYPFAAVLGHVVFREAYKWNHVLATILVVVALVVFYINPLGKTP